MSQDADEIILRLPRRGGAQHVLDVLASLLGAMLVATYAEEHVDERRDELVEIIDRSIAGNRAEASP